MAEFNAFNDSIKKNILKTERQIQKDFSLADVSEKILKVNGFFMRNKMDGEEVRKWVERMHHDDVALAHLFLFVKSIIHYLTRETSNEELAKKYEVHLQKYEPLIPLRDLVSDFETATMSKDIKRANITKFLREISKRYEIDFREDAQSFIWFYLDSTKVLQKKKVSDDFGDDDEEEEE